jgi:hypothetical protein
MQATPRASRRWSAVRSSCSLGSKPCAIRGVSSWLDRRRQAHPRACARRTGVARSRAIRSRLRRIGATASEAIADVRLPPPYAWRP